MTALPEYPIAEGRIAEIYEWEDGQVLKLAREWVPDDWLSREFAIAQKVFATRLSVPKPIALTTVDGRAGIVFERVSGTTMLAHLAKSPLTANKLSVKMAAIQLEIHTKEAPASFPSVKKILGRAITQLDGVPAHVTTAALEQLTQLPTGEQLLHMDYHPDNIMLSADDAVIIDWPTAARGHPLADVARTTLLLQVGSPPNQPILKMLVQFIRKSFLRVYQRNYFKHSPHTLADLDAWMLPTLVARLNEDIPNEHARLTQRIKTLLPPERK